MSLSIGILGLPNVGKSTLFKALTRNPVDISNYPFCTIKPNIGIVEVPDSRLDKLVEVIHSKKKIPSIIKFVDVAGLVKGASQGKGLGNQFLAHLRETDVLLQVVRCFKEKNVVHIEGEINPKRDIDTINQELILKDLETIEKREQKIEKEVKKRGIKSQIEFKILKKLKKNLREGKLLFLELKNFQKEEKKIIKNLFLLTAKPQIYLLNGKEEEINESLKHQLEGTKRNWICLDLKEELDKSELTPQEREEFGLDKPKLDDLIKKSYQVLGLITFFTIVGEKESRAWSVKNGTTILEGAEKIHSDFKEKFIAALVINWKKLIEIGNWQECQEKGFLKIVGKDYVLQDGDVIEIKI